MRSIPGLSALGWMKTTQNGVFLLFVHLRMHLQVKSHPLEAWRRHFGIATNASAIRM